MYSAAWLADVRVSFCGGDEDDSESFAQCHRGLTQTMKEIERNVTDRGRRVGYGL